MSQPQKIYVVDDDQSIRELIASYLKKHGFDVETAESGTVFLSKFQIQATTEAANSLVVLDIMMPGIDGFEVCLRLRKTSDIPVIMLTAVSDDTDRILGLELGADDYLAKPFNPRELLARIKAIFRRSQSSKNLSAETPRYCHFNHFCLDTLTRSLITNDNQQALSGADYNLLVLFIDHAGQVLSRDVIADHTRNRDSAPMDRFVDVHISRLRQCLGENAKSPEIIRTIRGEGYVMATAVQFSHSHQPVLESY
ncbi:DNA-binding response regulator [Endozoicomonas sp. OPT23]|uniref:response regulator n=1 Tax=Endozoicomonas sp. OPT23 TaxID=2072845 RepID=UPI00129A65F0|nr:response regulator transcription factor [Endozoicomonas sp. OPT23]MRI34047.1 DNA-binding response regulator [Endozoicomonas sp. OPT23]